MLYTIFALLAAALLALDQWLKAWITQNLPLGEAMPLVPGFVELRTVHNYGAAWSSFSGQRWLLIAVTALIMAAVVYLLVRRIVRHPLGLAACFLILSGGVGNLIDRVRMGYVVDMFNFLFMDYPVFNVADICVVCGAIVGAVYYLFFYDKYDKVTKDGNDASSRRA
ncbi:MAG: signal peptidase II [Oscillospiraceae bacterium]|nr:signal peptidase II [Oscillospiraceae bacterium]